MRYFPAFIDVADAPVLVVGNGEKAIQKLRLVAKTEAAVTIVATAPTPELRSAATEHGYRLVVGAFEPAHLDAARLVFAANDDTRADLAVADAARARGIAVNVVDRPDVSTFIVPAIVDRDPIMVAIGTEGTAPILAREIKSRLEASLPAGLGAVARKAAGLRDRIAAAVGDPTIRRRVWETLLRGAWRKAVLDGRDVEADIALAHALAETRTGAIAAGRVSLVGAGPGDPDLLTLKAQQVLQEADVIVIDGLVTPQILEYARRDARRIDVGKKGYGIATDQGAINQLIVREAAKGQHVVRLKGGDPFVFGRAAEEMAAVRAAGFAVDIVPGITAAHACAASIGLPLTLREKVRQFSVVTGATKDGLPDLDWAALARPGHAFAIYMGVRSAGLFRQNLIAAGADPALPIVIVENGTRPDERVFETVLGDLPDVIAAQAIDGPTIVFAGLSWEAAHLSPPAKVVRLAPILRGATETILPQPIAAKPARAEEAEHAWSPLEIANATLWVAG